MQKKWQHEVTMLHPKFNKMENKTKTEWFEKENFWINFAPIMFDDARWAEAPDVAEYVQKLAGLSKGDSVLDAGCGLGRISVELALLGLDVTGVDIIQAELDAAKESAAAEGVPLNLINADLRTFTTNKKYDCAVNLYTSFGYCDSIEEDMMILKNLCDSLKDNGTFIIECVSRETAILYFTEMKGVRAIKRTAGCLLFLACAVTSMWPVPARGGWQMKQTTDGSWIRVSQAGDEYYHFWRL